MFQKPYPGNPFTNPYARRVSRELPRSDRIVPEREEPVLPVSDRRVNGDGLVLHEAVVVEEVTAEDLRHQEGYL